MPCPETTAPPFQLNLTMDIRDRRGSIRATRERGVVQLYNIFAVGGRGQVPSTMEERGEISRTCPHLREEERGGEGYWVRRMTWERGWWRMLLLCGATTYHTATVPPAHTRTRASRGVPLMHDPESWKESNTFVIHTAGARFPVSHPSL
jgi:hypothetical protein